MEFEGVVSSELPRKPKFEKDFIMLSEFSELVGPIPVCIIPEEKARGNFNVNHFCVRIMSSDFQGSSGKLVGEDTQVILSETQDYAYAYVHYFSLNDNRARGFVRQFCLSYLTSSPSKIVDNFSELLEQFSQVTALLKAANHKLFLKDLLCHQADLDLTWKLLQDEGYTEMSKEELDQLYSGFDFTRQDVPERDPTQVTKDMEETGEIISAIKDRLESTEIRCLLEELQRLRGEYRDKRRMERERSNTFPQDSGSLSKGESSFTSYVPTFECGSIISSESFSSSDSIEYQPQRVMTHIVHKFERRLRTLDELSPRACPIAMERLKEIHKHFSRSELTLEMEKEEILLLDPRSSLLTIGRVPVLNMLQDYSPFSPDPSSPTHAPQDDEPYSFINQQRIISSVVSSIHFPVPYRITAINTWGIPNQNMEHSVLRVESQANSGFDSSFLEDKLGLKHSPLYINATYSPYHRSRMSDSFTTIEPLNGRRYSSRPDTDSDSNLLVLPTEDDESANFATPEGISPRSSEEEGGGEEGGWREKVDYIISRTGGSRGGGGVGVEGANTEAVASRSEGEDAVLNEASDGGQQLLLGPPDSGPPSLVVSYPPGPVVSGPPSLVVSYPPSPVVTVPPGSVVPGPVVSGPPGLVVCSNESLELSRNSSSPYYHLESGSQSTLTDSKEDFIRDPETPVEGPHRTGPAQGGDGGGLEASSGKGHQENEPDRTDGVSGISLRVKKLLPPVLSSRAEVSYSINSSGWEDQDNIVTSEPRSAGVGSYHGNSSSGNTTRDSSKGVSNHLMRLKTENRASRESSLSNSGKHNNMGIEQGNFGSGSGDQQPLSNGGPGGGGGGGGEGEFHQSGSWTKKKIGDNTEPPSYLKLSREQSFPEVYHTPVDSMSFFANSKPPYKFSPPAYHPLPSSLPISPSQRSFASITSMDTMFSERLLMRGPSVLEISGKSVLPLVSTVDFIESSYKFKPGKGIISFCKTTPIVTDLIYCLLQGRPLVLLGKSSDQNLIRRIIRVLWLFVPGHSSQKQIVAWQEAPLDIRDISRIKLIGLNSEFNSSLSPHIKRYISSWDCTTGKLCTPSYNGDLLRPIVSRTKDKKNEEVFLTHIHSVLLEIAMKAFVYYHGYCTLMPSNKKSSPYSSSPKKCHTVLEKNNSRKQKMAFLHKLGVKNSDEDIIEYLVDVIREQQLVEWGMELVNGSPLDAEPVRMHLQTKHCTESYCKPKRPY